MKRFNFYLSLMLLLVFTAACSDEFDQPPMVVPTAEHHANMTIAEFKAKHWQDARNYIDTVTEDEIIHGWVTSSDESGNIYKNLYICCIRCSAKSACILHLGIIYICELAITLLPIP